MPNTASFTCRACAWRLARRLEPHEPVLIVIVNRTCLSKLEKGTSHPGMEITATLATALEVEPIALLRMPLG
jgi:hypothetical protein